MFNKPLLISALVILIGVIIFSVAMTALKWDFSKLSTSNLKTTTHTISDHFDTITIKTTTADITFVPSDGVECRVVCKEHENEKHSVNVQNGILSIELNDERAWYEHIGIISASPEITVYLPEKEYSELFIKESTGDVTIPDDFGFKRIDVSLSTGDVKNYATASEEISIKVTTGDVNLERTTAGKIIVLSSTGDVNLKNTTADKIIITSSTGDIAFNGIDASEIEIKTSTGDVKGSLLSEKVFFTKSSTGDVEVPETLSGGKCKITTSTGDIKISIDE